MKITALSKNISQYESFNRLVIGQPGFEPVGLGPVEARKMHKTSSKWIIQLKSYENTKNALNEYIELGITVHELKNMHIGQYRCQYYRFFRFTGIILFVFLINRLVLPLRFFVS